MDTPFYVFHKRLDFRGSSTQHLDIGNKSASEMLSDQYHQGLFFNATLQNVICISSSSIEQTMSFNSTWPDNQSTDDERPAKTRRIARACLQVSDANLRERRDT